MIDKNIKKFENKNRKKIRRYRKQEKLKIN